MPLSFARHSLVSCDVARAMQTVTTSSKDRTARPMFPVWELLDRRRADGRGGSAVVDVVAPLAGLLVLRWAAFIEAEQEAVASFNDTGFSPVLPDTLHQKAWHSPDELASGLVGSLDGLGGRGDVAILKYASAVAPSIRQCADRDAELLGLLVSWAARLAFETSDGRDAAAKAFDEVLVRVVETQGKYGGEFTTPEPVVEMMIQLVDPRPGDRVYDPCFGVGGLLVQAARRLRAAAATDTPRRWDEVRTNGIFGVEINSSSFAIGLCRVVLAGIEQPGLELGDALERPLPRNRATEGFDCIVAAPPWGSRIADTKARQYPVPTGGIENLFLQHVMANLRPGGRAVIALPEGTLFRTGADRQVRKNLLSEFRVDGVVSLPEGAFAPCTSIPSSLVVFRRETPRANVRFARVPAKAWPTRLSGTGYGGGTGDGAGFGDGTGYGGGTGDGGGVGHGEYGYATAEGDGYGDGRPYARSDTAHVLLEVPALLRHERELSSQQPESGVEAWEVPTRTLAGRDYELIAKRTGTEELETTLGRLRAADPGLQVVPLEQLAEVAQGVSYERKLTTESRNGAALAPLVRVGDVVDPHVKRPALFFTADAAARVRETHRLRRGDLLITTSGTVGKLGVIDDEHLVGAVATKSLVVIRPREGAAPAFLAAILRSPGYQEWILGHARGATIQHLSVRTLRKLPIPLPPLPVQDAVLRNLATGADALAMLIRHVAGGTADPIAAWLERPAVVSLLSEKTVPQDPAKNLSEAGRELMELRPIRNKMVHAPDDLAGSRSGSRSGSHSRSRSGSGSGSWSHSRSGSGPEAGLSAAVARWLIEAVEIAAVLVGIDAVPAGAPRLATLELAKTRMDGARRAIESDDSPVATRLCAFMVALARLAEHAAASMLGTVAVTLRVEPTEIVVGVPTEVRLNLRNESTAGLRTLRVTTRPDVGTGDVAYLAEAASIAVPLTIHAHTSGQPFRISVRWSALRLDGALAQGEETVDLLVRSTREAVRAGDLGASPYIVGNPIDREEMFFGRTDVIERIGRQLGSTTNANVILLEGNRRTGKTSILKQLQKKGALPGWVVVYCSFQDAEGDETRAGISTRNVYRLLARTIGWSLFDAGIRTWFPGEPPPDSKRPFKVEFRSALDRVLSDDHPFETFELYLGAALAAARPHRVLLMLDEFDKLQEGIDTGVTSPQVPENIRHILQHHPGLSAILTGSRRLKRLREEYWSALFGLGYRVGISSLPLEDARRLVTQPVADRLSYLPQARDRVVEICAAQPFLVQSLCNRVFERAASSDDRTITTAAVNQAAIEMVRENEHFRTLWDYAQTHRRRLLLALCERLADGPDAINLEFLSARVEAVGVHVPRQSLLGDDLEYLRELELIEFDKSYRGGTYRIAVPLLGMWIQASIDFDDAVARAREEAQEAHP